LSDAISKVKDVSKTKDGKPDVKFVDVRTSRADVGQPESAPLVEALVSEIATVNTADTNALRTAIGVCSPPRR